MASVPTTRGRDVAHNFLRSYPDVALRLISPNFRQNYLTKSGLIISSHISLENYSLNTANLGWKGGENR